MLDRSKINQFRWSFKCSFCVGLNTSNNLFSRYPLIKCSEDKKYVQRNIIITHIMKAKRWHENWQRWIIERLHAPASVVFDVAEWQTWIYRMQYFHDRFHEKSCENSTEKFWISISCSHIWLRYTWHKAQIDIISSTKIKDWINPKGTWKETCE